jgi:anthranilate phosphoribosyltransferase
MSIAFRLSHELGRTVVAVTGEPDFDEAGILYVALVELIDGDGELNVVLDLRGLESTTPAIALVLDRAGTLVREHGGRLLASAPHPE